MSERSADDLYWNPWTLRFEPDEPLSPNATEVSSRWDAAERDRIDEQVGANARDRQPPGERAPKAGLPGRHEPDSWNPRLVHPELGERPCLTCLDAAPVPDPRTHARHRTYDPGHLPREWRVTKTTRNDSIPVGTGLRLVAWRLRVSYDGWRTSSWLLTAIDGPLAGSTFRAVRRAKRTDADAMVTPPYLERASRP